MNVPQLRVNVIGGAMLVLTPLTDVRSWESPGQVEAERAGVCYVNIMPIITPRIGHSEFVLTSCNMTT
jgi:hypothetical protein